MIERIIWCAYLLEAIGEDLKANVEEWCEKRALEVFEFTAE